MTQQTGSKKKRYAAVGVGGRAIVYLDAIAGNYTDACELVGLCDLSHVRMQWHLDRLKRQFGFAGCATYHADQFDEMIAQVKPDVVLVCSTDATHHEYLVRAMDLGCDTITEKPMTTDEAKARAIFDAIERTGKQVRVTFNARFSPLATKVYELLRDGAVGEIKAVDLAWSLDTSHGADYFRRWHREKRHSGGLLLHKSTHHFDMVNWWVQSRPKTVFAMGGLEFYGKSNAEARGERYDYDRYTGVEAARKDPFARPLDRDFDNHDFILSSDVLQGLYAEAEAETGYLRDRNVFGEGITSEDTMSVMCRYQNNVLLNYSLIAYSPWEGYRCVITGTKGRLEVEVRGTHHVVDDAGESNEGDAENHKQTSSITVHPMFKRPYDVPIPAPRLEGTHGGSDPLLCEQMFAHNPPPDPFNRAASHIDGAASILLGICANHSMASGRPVNADDLLPLDIAAHA